MATTEGPLVLADISGYTKFRLEMAQLEGDAVFFVGEGVAPELIQWLEGPT